jgi:Cysteine-rich domain
MKIALFVPCFVDQLMPQMGLDTAAVLKRSGYEVEFRKEQTCCGQPAFNSGYWNDARPLAERFVRVFKSAEMVVCPSGSCTTMVRIFYPELLAGTASHAEAAGPTIDGATAARATLRATPTKPFPNPGSLWSETRRRSTTSSISTCDKTFRCGASSACSNSHENC